MAGKTSRPSRPSLKRPAAGAPGLSRRCFLRAASLGLAAAAHGLASCSRGEEGRAASPAPSAPPASPASPAPAPGARVVEVRDAAALDAQREASVPAVERLLAEALVLLTGQASAEAAWASLFGAGDVVGIKVNCNGRPGMVTRPAVAFAIARALVRAGVRENDVIIWERNNWELEAGGYAINTGASGVRVYGSEDTVGFDENLTRFASGSTRFSRILTEQCTKIINAPVLKTMIDRTYGISNAVKYVYGLIDNPGAFHRNAVPACAQLYALPQVRDKTRLVLCDALLVQIDEGPWDAPQHHRFYHSLLASFDPVALDVRGFAILEELRGRPIRPAMPYVHEAGRPEYGLGTDDPSRIELVRRDLTA